MTFVTIHRLFAFGVIVSAFTASPTFANEPGRGSEKDIRSAEGAALQNQQYDRITQADSFATKNAQELSRELGTDKQPGRGKPSDVRSAKGAAVQNSQSFGAANNADGIPKSEESKANGINKNNPGGMMNHYPPN